MLEFVAMCAVIVYRVSSNVSGTVLERLLLLNPRRVWNLALDAARDTYISEMAMQSLFY